MVKTEAQSFFDAEVVGRYRDWDPTVMEISDWVFALQRFSREIALVGLRQFAATREGGWKKPQIAKVTEMCRELLRKEGGGDKEQTGNQPVRLFALTCVEHEACPKRVGMTQNFYAGTPKQVPGDKSIIQRYAEKLVARFGENIYGGKWAIIRFWDDIKLLPESSRKPVENTCTEDLPF